MAFNVSPTEDRPSHHLGLTLYTNGLGSVDVGLKLCSTDGMADPDAIQESPFPNSPLKTYTGSQEYADFEEPFSIMDFKDWSGGRGSKSYDEDKTRYFDGHGVQTWQEGRLLLGPLEAYAGQLRGMDQNWHYRDVVSLGAVEWVWNALQTDGQSNYRYLSYLFTATQSYSAKYIVLKIRKIGTPTGALTVAVYSNSSGKPGTLLKSVTIAASALTNFIANEYRAAFATTLSITAGTIYHIVVFGAATDDAYNCYQVLCENDYSDTLTTACKSADGSTWTAGYDEQLRFRLTEEEKSFKAFFFDYKGAKYLAQQYDDGTNPRLWINGDQGVATAGGATSLTDSAKSWTVNEFVGCVVRIHLGTGSDTPTPWRVITANTGTALTVSPAWDTNPTTDSEYSIQGAEKWREITGHGITTRITDVLSVNSIVYFALGEATKLRRMRRVVSTGAWTNEFADDGNNNTFTFLRLVPGDNGMQIWGAKRQAGTVASATAQNGAGSSPSDLNFGSAIAVGDQGERINGLDVYGEPSALHVFKDGGVYYMNKGVPTEIKATGLKNVRSLKNGAASLSHNVYLFFSVLNTWQRYYRGSFDGVGPDRDEGLPSDRSGPVSFAISYPTMQIIGIDAGESGYSSVLVGNELGWHEIYRAPAAGMRIRSGSIQTVEGDTIDRLWISVGSDIVWIPIDPNPEKAPDLGAGRYSYRYTDSGWMQTGIVNHNLDDVGKYYHSIKLYGENFYPNGGDAIYFQYILDDDTSYTEQSWVEDDQDNIEMAGFTGNDQELHFTPEGMIYGKRIRMQMTIFSTGNSDSPVLHSWVLKSTITVPVKSVYTVTFSLSDNEVDLNGDVDDHPTIADKLTHLKAFATDPRPVEISSLDPMIDGKWVKFLEGIPVRKLATLLVEGRQTVICQARLVEV